MTQINAAYTLFVQRAFMPRIICYDLEELAELRKKAALLCEETKELIEVSRRLRKWLKGMEADASDRSQVGASTPLDSIRGAAD